MIAFVDTNVILRLLTADDPNRAWRSAALFERAQRGEIELVTSEAIVAEIVYVLSSPVTYRFDRAQIATAVRPLLESRGLRLDHKGTVVAALDRYEAGNLDFADCLAIEHTRHQQLDGLYSYDRKLDRAQEIRRLEP